MIEDLALRRPACRPVLTSRIAGRSPFGGDMGLRYLDICASGLDEKSADGDVHDVCRALAGLAGRQPEGVARSILAMAGSGAYADRHGGRVLEELGRAHASAASGAILKVLSGPHGPAVSRHLPSMMRRLGTHADMREAAGPFLGALDSVPAAARHCLTALYALAVCNHLGRRDGGAAAAILGRLRDHAANAGVPVQARHASAMDPCAELCSLIDDLRRPGAAARSDMEAATGYVFFKLPYVSTSRARAALQGSTGGQSDPAAASVPLVTRCALALPRNGGSPGSLVILQPEMGSTP